MDTNGMLRDERTWQYFFAPKRIVDAVSDELAAGTCDLPARVAGHLLADAYAAEGIPPLPRPFRCATCGGEVRRYADQRCRVDGLPECVHCHVEVRDDDEA